MKAIFFDLDGTLVRFPDGYRDVLVGTFETVCGEVREEWIETYSEAFGERRAGWAAYRYEGGGFGDLPDALPWE